MSKTFGAVTLGIEKQRTSAVIMPRMPKKQDWMALEEAIITVSAKDGTKVEQVYVLPPSEKDFVEPIGQLLLSWSIYEKYIVGLICALIAVTGEDRKNWYGLPFSKKFETMKELWLVFCKDQPNLKKLPANLAAETEYAKTLREHLTHNIIECGTFVPGNKFVRFRLTRPPSQYTKRYFLDDFKKASSDLQKAAGQIYHLRVYYDSLPLTLQEKQLLRTLPDMRFQPPPTGPSPQHQS